MSAHGGTTEGTRRVENLPRHPMQGASSFLATALSDRVTITGAHTSTHYSEHVTGKLTMGLADEEPVVIAGDG